MTSPRTSAPPGPGRRAGTVATPVLAVLGCVLAGGVLAGCDEHSTTGPDAPATTAPAAPTSATPRPTLDLTPPGQGPKATVSASVRPGAD